MQYRIFVIPIKNHAEAVEEMNLFLRSKRVLSVHKEFVAERENSFWTFVAEYLDTPAPMVAAASPGKPKIDYKELLQPDEFALFSRLRALRKDLAARESIPVYAVFTNEQLAEMARRRVRTKADLTKIEGIGEAKVARYGLACLDLMAAATGIPAGSEPESGSECAGPETSSNG